MPNYSPDFVSPPGETIHEMMQERGWGIRDLADELELDYASAFFLMDGSLRIDDRLAVRLAEVFGPSVSFWVNRERAYCTWKEANNA